MLSLRRRKPALLTFTLKSLSHYPPEKGATVVTERGHLVVVNAELVWDVDAEPLLCDLGEEKDTSQSNVFYDDRRGSVAMTRIMMRPELGILFYHAELSCYMGLSTSC